MKKKLLVSISMALMLATGIFSGAIVPSAVAQEVSDSEKPPTRIGISPAKEKAVLKPGDHYRGSFKILNTGSQAFDFDVYVKPYSINGDCVDNYDAENSFTQMSRWVKLDQSSYFGLQPDHEQIVTYSVDVPMDAPAGGQYIVIFVETMGDDTEQSGMVKTSRRIGLKLYGDLGGMTRQAGEVVSVEQSQFYLDPPTSSVGKVRNAGNIEFQSRHTYKVASLSGKELYTNTTEIDVLPDTCRAVTSTWDATPAFGLFYVTNTIHYIDQPQFEETKLVLIIPLYVLLIFAGVLALVIWAAILRIRKNSRKNR
ncbi:MAG: hypothetical protein LBC95_03035 [Candidatus Nomurabacteria bacterium]|jgi:hypothetical protein|nr:hypothetical protein [Candidatus Nomurabacteria bacterium]